jgi:hypothetical protein
MERLSQRLRSPLSEMIGEHAAGAGRGQAEADTLAIFFECEETKCNSQNG